ncbi:MAG: NAD(P)-dependent oxidoreductase [Phycisphaera sp. TMED9]|nr:MAG: NAD(P)-dependent oxidoreductase [Phycisphaera sp. TMED9]
MRSILGRVFESENGSTTVRIGWIGCGVMGTSMIGHLLENGHGVRVFTRTRSRASAVLEKGADWAESPREAAEGTDAVVSIVGFPADVEAVHLGADGTLAATRLPPILIDMTTSDPALAIRLHAAAASRGVAAIDAPVSGGDVGARQGTLSIMIGGDSDAVESARPIFEACGGTIVHQGGPGAGQKTKIVNQILVAASMIGACEAILFAARAGLDARTVLKSVAPGAAGSWTLSNLVPRMLDGDFEPGFFIDHFVKDLGIAVREARDGGLDLPGLEMAERFYCEAQEEGLGSKGTQALLLLLESQQQD